MNNVLLQTKIICKHVSAKPDGVTPYYCMENVIQENQTYLKGGT